MSKNGMIYAAAGIAFVAAIGGFELARRSIFTVEDGMKYLRDDGYSQITGGERDYFNACSKGTFARSFDAVKNKKKENITVCYSIFIGPYRPLLWEY